MIDFDEQDETFDGADFEQVLSILGERIADYLLRGDVGVEEHLGPMYEKFLRFYDDAEFHLVLWDASMCLTEKYYENMEFAKEARFMDPYLDLAEQCIDLRSEIDMYSARLVLARVFGREADPAVMHSTSGPH